VVALDAVVGMLLDVMPRGRDQLVQHRWVHRRGVGDHLAGRHLQHRERLLEEPPGRLGVAAGREEHVDDLPVLVDRAVDVPPDPVDLDVGSSTNQRSPGACRVNRAASASSGVNRCTHR
jgi:hypothetical protein